MAPAVVGVIPFLNASREWLDATAVGMVIVQACDPVIGLTLHDRMRPFGPAGTAVANLAALLWLTVQ